MIPDCRHGSCPNGCEPCSKPHHAISDFCVSIASQNSINSWIAGIVVGLGLHAIVKKYAFRPRMEDGTAHTLRHSLANNLVDASTPLD